MLELSVTGAVAGRGRLGWRVQRFRHALVERVVEATRADRPGWMRYGLATALALSSSAAGWWLSPALGVAVSFVLFCPAVIVAAWYGGLGPGLLATGLSGVANISLFEEPAGLALGWPGGVVRQATFVLTGAAVSILSEVLHEARRQQEESVRRAERLAELQRELDGVSASLAGGLRVPQVAEMVVGQGCALLGASAGTLVVRDEGSSVLRTVYAVGYPPGVESERVIELNADEPISEAVRKVVPVVLESRRASDRRYPHLADTRDVTGTEGVTALPLVLHGRVLGGIGFSFTQPRPFTRRDLPLMQALAYQAALALESAGRHARERAARRRAEASGERQRFLAGANACLAASMDYAANLREVARLAVPALAEGCAIHVREGDAGLKLLAAFHADSERGLALEELGRRQRELQADGFWRAFQTRQPELLENAEGEWLERARDAGERELVKRLTLGSSLSVPLMARERALGVISFVTTRGGAVLGVEDLEQVKELSARASAAMDNALLFEEAQRLNRVKDEFLALLSHELRTPLGSALVWLELLRSEKLDAGGLRAVEMIHRSARQLAELIDQLLDVSRIVAGKLSVEKQTTDVSAVVEGVLEAAGPAAKAKGLRLQSEVARTLERIWADPNRLRQALSNLVLNAIKFTPEGGVVSVSLKRVGNLARMEVKDTGAGVAPELLPHIFERFRQGDTKSTRSHGGLGLGLAIAQYIAEQHEGSVRAASPGVGSGSVFTLDIPMKSPPSRGLALPSGGAGAQPSLEALRVLLVDDHYDTLHGLALGLQANGAEVTPVSSAREALAELPRVKPHVIVSDLAMPEQDGYALISQIRRLPPEAGGLTPAVAVSAYASPEDRRRALRAGYQEHVPKPVEMSQLVNTIARLGAET